MLLLPVHVKAAWQHVGIVLPIRRKLGGQLLSLRIPGENDVRPLSHKQKGILLPQRLVHLGQILRILQPIRLIHGYVAYLLLWIDRQAVKHLHGISREEIYLLAEPVGFLKGADLIIAQSRDRAVNQKNRNHSNCNKSDSQTGLDLHNYSPLTKIWENLRQPAWFSHIF